jgi:serine/threonine-protein kinase
MDPPPPKNDANGAAGLAEPGRLGKYPLLSVVGKGSMGVIYKSMDPHIKRPVALKTIRRDLLAEDDSEHFSARFRIEAQAAGGLAHPGIVSVYEYGEEGVYAYIAMEFVDGKSLRECFEQRVAFSISQVVNLLTQLLEALQYAHDRGVWHRDIKPANILVTGAGQVKVTDFGIARVESSMLTQVGAIMGTPGFIAPEMYLGESFDNRVDLFAAGAVLYQLIAGVPAFFGTAEKVMFKVCYEAPLPPSVAARLPSLQHFDAVVMKALARRPEDRFATAAEFLAALRGAQEHRGGYGGADETIIQSPEPGGAPPQSQPPTTNTLIEGGWDVDSLTKLESRLAHFVGPIAKVMVRRGTRHSTNLPSLVQWLANNISGSDDREAFLRDVGAIAEPIPWPGKPARAPADGKGQPAATAPPRPLTPGDVDRASRLLIEIIGPIAAVVAKRAAQPGSTREEFVAAIASRLPDEADRARFLKRFG